jgi:pyridoxine 4-dehydrogenase
MTNVTAAVGGEFLLGGDLRVNRLGLGAMRLVANSLTGPPRNPAAGVAVLRRAVELGVNHIDTAGFYRLGGTSAHELIREALSPYRDDVVIATKVGPLRDADGVFHGQAGPEELRGLVEEDLRRLGVPRLDLVYLRPDGMSGPDGASVAERFAVLAELREAGLIRHLGLSNVDAAQLAEARSIAPVVAVQNHFHLQHDGDRQLLADCERLGIAYVPFFPLGGGVSMRTARVHAVAERLSASVAQVALAWLLAVSPVTLAIPGTGSVAHLAENVAAAGIRLGRAELDELAG